MRMSKTKVLSIVIISLFIGSIIIPSTTSDESISNRQTYVSGPITSDTIWTLVNSPYIVVGSVLINNGVTLTIEPGVTVKFTIDKALQVDGTLVAQGSSNNIITFTSNQTIPIDGDWGYISFTDLSDDATYDGSGNYVSGCILEYCIIEYGGGTSGNGVIRIESSSPFIHQCNIRNNSKSGIAVKYGSPKITFNTIEKNGNGILLQFSNSVISDNIITNNSKSFMSDISSASASNSVEIIGNTISNNHRNGISFYATAWGSYFTMSAGIVAIGGDPKILNNSITSHSGSGYLGGGICCFSDNIQVKRNIIENNTGTGINAGIYPSTKLSILNNNITYNLNRGIEGGNEITIIDKNYICYNNVNGIGGGIKGYGLITNNSIIGNSATDYPALYVHSTSKGGIYYNIIINNMAYNPDPTSAAYINGDTNFTYNNIYDNNALYLLYNGNPQGSPNLNATNNWWGTTDESEIQAMIYDWFDDTNRGIVDYLPFLLMPYTTNHPPNQPKKPTGPTARITGQSGTYWANGTDPDGDQLQYRFDWNASGSHTYSTWTSLVNSGQKLSMSHSWAVPGTYVIKVQARDEHGVKSVWSNGLTVTVTINHPPNQPQKPTGPTTRLVGQQGTYWANATDSDGDKIQYRFDWNASGSHTYSTWTSLVNSGQTVNMTHAWSSPGTYVVKTQARDEHGSKSTWSNGLTVTVTVNHPPNQPKRPTGPTTRLIGQQGTYWANGTDPDGDQIQYRFDWNASGSHQYSAWTSLVNSGQKLSKNHTWTVAGTYVVKVQSKDEHGVTSTWSNGLNVTVANHAPNQPKKPTGPTTRLIGQQGTYWANGTDPDGDQIQYRFDWNASGSHQYSAWTSLVNSGQKLSKNHSWAVAGTYVVKVQSRDEHGATSVWSNGLTVIVHT